MSGYLLGMKTTVPAIRRIIREELQRALINEAINILCDCVGQELLREWNYTPVEQQKQIRKYGGGKFVDAPESTGPDPGQLMQATLQMLNMVKADPKADVGKVVKQLETLHAALKNSKNTVHSTTWAAAVKKALDVVSQLQNNPGHESRSSRLQFAQNKIETLGKNITA